MTHAKEISDVTPIPVNEERLWSSLLTLAEHGGTGKGGVNRLALSEADRQARSLLVDWGKAAGCAVEIDTMGNIFLRRPGRQPDLPAVGTGSHLDTQPTGGKFDGAFGVLAGLEVIRTLNDLGIETKHSLDLVAWTNEEGSRFDFGGSAVFAGKEPLQRAYDAQDSDDIRFEDALTAIGAKGALPCIARPYDSFFEAHIEQGPILEAKGLQVGVVSGARGESRYAVSVRGQEGHAGTTPMSLRRDALVSAARLITGLEEVGKDHPPQGVCTVGALSVSPNSINTIPGQVDFSIDLRHPTDIGLGAMEKQIDALFRTETCRPGIEVNWERLIREDPVTFDAKLIALLHTATRSLDLQDMALFSMAGHDACYIADLFPTGMIFVPCKDGLSHNELESAKPEDLAAGASVLATAMLARAVKV